MHAYSYSSLSGGGKRVSCCSKHRIRGALISVVTPVRGGSHLRRLQVLSVFHPPEGRFGLPGGFTLPHHRVIDELLDVLRLLDEMRRSWKHEEEI